MKKSNESSYKLLTSKEVYAKVERRKKERASKGSEKLDDSEDKTKNKKKKPTKDQDEGKSF
jgi:hypothetical protein